MRERPADTAAWMWARCKKYESGNSPLVSAFARRDRGFSLDAPELRSLAQWVAGGRRGIALCLL